MYSSLEQLKQQNQEISHLCEEILSINKDIFFVSSLSKNGRLVDSKFCNDRIISKMSKQEIESLFMQRTLQTSIGLEFDDLIGPLDFIILQRNSFRIKIPIF